MRRRTRRRLGLTLIEVLIAAAILSFAVAAVAQSIAAGHMQTYESLRQLRAISLAEALIEEIESKDYADPEGATDLGPDAGESDRTAYDNADDYHGYDESGADPLLDQAGNAYPAPFQVFERSVTCSYETLADTGLGTPADGLLVTVTVTDDRGLSWTVTRFIPEPGV